MSYLDPALPLLFLLGFAGLIRAWRRSDRGKRPWLLTLSLGGLFLLSTHAFAWLFALPLQGWYDSDDRLVPQGDAEAIVVLSGSVNAPEPGRPYSYVGHDTYARLQHGLWLYRNWKPLPILVCGGSFGDEAPHAEAMERLLRVEGIPADRVWSESRSRSTYENAVFGAEILRSHGVTRVALVVEANSMLRAEALFERAGIRVLPAPIRFARLEGDPREILPDWRAISMNAESVHEYGGLLWYWLRGRI